MKKVEELEERKEKNKDSKTQAEEDLERGELREEWSDRSRERRLMSDRHKFPLPRRD